MAKRILVFGCALAMTSLAPAHSGAWTQPAGHGQIISTTRYSAADDFYDDRRDIAPADFEKVETQLYLEHGLTERLTLVGSTVIQKVAFTAGDTDVSYSGFGTSELGARFRLWEDKNTVLSLQSTFIFPSGGETIADADLGVGGIAAEERILLGQSFGPKAFANVEAAVRYEGDRTPIAFRGEATFGYRPRPRIQVMSQLFYNTQPSKRDLSRTSDALKGQLSVTYDRKENTTYQFGVYRTLAGRNIVRENAFFVGVWRRY